MTTDGPGRRPAAPWLLVCTLAVGCASAPHPAPSGSAATGCSPAQRRDVLRAVQQRVLDRVPRGVRSLDEAIGPGGPLAGWRLSHGHVVLAGAGGVAVDSLTATDPLPQLLLYAPSPSSAPADWLDFEHGDGPYELLGWGYLVPYQPGSEPPSRPCILASEWLVHEAGWHLMDGGMLLTPGATAEPPRPDVPVYFWHPRAWDLHLWIGADGVPTVAHLPPNPRSGGVVLPDAAFLRFEQGRWVPAGPH